MLIAKTPLRRTGRERLVVSHADRRIPAGAYALPCGERASFDAEQAEFLRSRGIVSIVPAQPSLSSLREVTVTRPLRRAVTKDNAERS